MLPALKALPLPARTVPPLTVVPLVYVLAPLEDLRAGAALGQPRGAADPAAERQGPHGDLDSAVGIER